MKKTTTILMLSLMLLLSISSNAQEMWGTTLLGYGDGNGNFTGGVFKTDISGDNYQAVFSGYFEESLTPKYSALCEVNGKLFGMTTETNGTDILPEIFVYDPLNNVNGLVHKFVTLGEIPSGSLILASNNKLYGMTSDNIFELDPVTYALTNIFTFVIATGITPRGSLFQASNGKLYGMTSIGGANDFGVIFEYDLATSSYTVKHDFDEAATGATPWGDLMEATNGKFYGMTSSRGLNDLGVIFEFDPTTGICTKKHDFDGAATGSSLIPA